MNLTDQQKVAVTTEGRALVVEAGAGTGKTAVLVQRFLHLLERHPEWPIDSIVAVTFTEKATREMRSRIRAAVEHRASAASPASSWEERRRDLDRLAVSTIHGLCARILRENPIAAVIDPRFRVLEEQETALLREEAVRRALTELASGMRSTRPGEPDPFDLLTDFETHDLRDQMVRLLGQRGTVDRLFTRSPTSEGLLAEWQVRVQEMQSAIWSEYIALNGECVDALEQLASLTISQTEDRLAEHVRSAQDGWARARAGDVCGAAACFGSIKRNVGSAAAWGGKEGLAAIKEWLRLAQELGRCLTDKGYEQPIGAQDARAAEALQQWRALWEYTTGVYDGLKAEQRALDFDDLERLAWRLLTAQPRDERVQATIDGLNHLMVDEFQDVNEVQGEILTALAELTVGGKFFAVGDAKQSIYRFRQAQVKVFNRVTHEIEQCTGHGPLALNQSFRTETGLLTALNDAFEQVLGPIGAAHTDFEARPGALHPQRPALGPFRVTRSAVEIVVLPPGLADANRRVEASLLVQRLHQLVRREFKVWDRQSGEMRPARYGDIAVLFRATTSLPIYEEVFKAQGLPYLAVSGRGYYDRPEVRDLTALLACLHNPSDDLSTAIVLRSPMFSLSDEALYRLRWFDPDGKACDTPIRFSSALASALTTAPHGPESDQIVAAAETMAGLHAAARRVDVWTLLRMALDRTGYEATLALADMEATTRTSAGGGRGRANLAKFLQLARERGRANLSTFLQAVQDLSEREAREGEALPDAPDAGSVQLMSVHAAKGLEFPIIVLADMGRAPRGSGQSPRILHDPMFGLACQVRDEDSEWVKPASYRWAEWLDGRMDQAESKRLLYVACTRAADLLILSGSAKESGSWLATLADAWDLDLGEDAPERTADREALIERDGYRIRIAWPAPPDEESVGKQSVAQPLHGESRPVLTEVPPLAQPRPFRRATWPVAVTHLPEEPEVGDEPPQLRPVVQTDDVGTRGRRPWRYLLGNLAHRALADWKCLAAPEEELQVLLTRWARRGGLFAPEDVRAAVARVARMLVELRSTPLYREICAARERHSEVPLSIFVGDQTLHGVLDLLYCDRDGNWRLLDWKTEPVRKGQMLQDAATPYLRQLAVYNRAVEQLLGFRARAEICFLAAHAAVHHPTDDELAREWNALQSK